MTPAGPLVIPSDCQNHVAGKYECGTRRHGVIFISLVEIFGSATAMSLYIYVLVVEPDWYTYLVPIPSDLCNISVVVRGVMYIIVLLCALELMMALYLFEGARREKLSIIRFWLSSMLTYLTLVTVIILGLDLGGFRCPSLNCAAFINIFLRFIEILSVYGWADQEAVMRKLRLARGLRSRRREQSQGRSTLTVYSFASDLEGDLGTTYTPPPSYSDTIPSRSFQQQQQHLPVSSVSSQAPSLSRSTTPQPQEQQQAVNKQD